MKGGNLTAPPPWPPLPLIPMAAVLQEEVGGFNPLVPSPTLATTSSGPNGIGDGGSSYMGGGGWV